MRLKRDARSPDVVAVAMLLMGPLFLLAGVVALVWNIHFISSAATAEGRVIELVDTSSPGESAQYKAKVSYDVAGETYTGHSTWSTAPAAFDVGERVQVLYDPAKPSSMMLDTFFEKWFIALIFLGIGNLFTIIGLIRARRSDAQQGITSKL